MNRHSCRMTSLLLLIWLCSNTCAVATPGTRPDFDTNVGDDEISAFRNWLNSHGVATDKAAPSLFNAMGLGLIAEDVVSEGQLLFKVPLKLTFSRSNSLRHAQIGPFMNNKGLKEEDYLAIALLHERRLELEGTGSEWGPYLRVLPRYAQMKTPATFSASELQELRGSPTAAVAARDVQLVARAYERVRSDVFDRHRDVFPEKYFSKADLTWAWFIVQSRAWTIKGVKTLVPLADMLNYEHGDNSQDAFLKYHTVGKFADEYAELYSDRAVAAGEQIVESYGDNSNQMYFRYFGFVPKVNPSDCVDVPMPLPPKHSQLDFNELLRSAQLQPGLHVCQKRGAIDAQALTYLRVTNLRQDEGVNIDAVRTQNGVSVRNERAAHRAFVKAVQTVLDQYPTPIQLDQDTVDDMDATDLHLKHTSAANIGHSQRAGLAVRLRLSERKVLMDARDRAQQFLKSKKKA